MRILVILILISSLAFGQKTFSYTINIPYPERVEMDFK